MRLALPCLVFVLAASSVGHAEVSESLDTQYYEAKPQPGQSLLAALDHASPIRQGGQIYHGYTRWDIRWHFNWQKGSGRCAISRVNVSLKGNIQLPQLAGGNEAQRRAFARYIPALREHELGHFRIGQEAAAAIDRHIRELPPAPDCALLEHAANEGATRTLAHFQQKERDYDTRTGHGKTQGAWLER